MKITYKVFASLLMVQVLMFTQPLKAQQPETKLGWQLGAQAWTFHNFTFTQAVEKIDSCRLKYVEGYPKQMIGNGIPGTMDYHMDGEQRVKVLAMLKKKGVKMVSYGVITPSNDADWITLFEFAKAMGLQNITSEPKLKDIPMVSKLCDQYEINIAIHNHPKPAVYWNPDTLLNALKGQSERIGACADIGHWIRSGLDPVECLKGLQGHIIELHFKDLNEKSTRAHDVPWGTGVSDIKNIQVELKRQGFKGLIAAEYEYNWDNSSADVAASVTNFRLMLKNAN